jgi:hypothetical protein
MRFSQLASAATLFFGDELFQAGGDFIVFEQSPRGRFAPSLLLAGG